MMSLLPGNATGVDAQQPYRLWLFLPVNPPPPDTDIRSTARQLARLAVIAAILSCSLNCVFNQLTARGAESLNRFGGLVGWGSLLIVFAGIALGIAGLIGGLKNRSMDTAAIALIGLVLNAGIVFVIVWYFVFVRPAV